MAQLVPAAPVPVGVPTSGGDVGSGSAPGVRARPRLVLFGLILAVSMTTIDQTIVSLTAPTIARSLGLSASGIEWAINAYLLAAAALFQLGGRLSDVFGYRRMVIVGSALFLAGSIVCGLVPGGSAAAGVLIAGRAVQGAGMAAMFPSAVGLLFVTVPAGGRASSMAKFFSITGAMTALGPILGSWLAPINWRLIFFVNVPLGLAALVVLMVAHVPRTRRPARIDLAGAALSGAGMFLLVFALQKIGAWGWGDLRVWTLVALGVAALVAFVATQRRAREPLLDLRVFADRAFCLATAAIAFSSMAFMAVFYFLSVYGQLSLNLPVLHSSELLFWFFLGFVLAARLGARHFDRAGLRSVLIIGGLLGAAGFGAVAARAGTIGAGADGLTVPLIVAGAGLGYMFSAASTDMANRSTDSSFGEVSALTQTMKNLGGALSLAVLTSLVSSRLVTNLAGAFASFGGTSAQARQVADALGNVTSGSGSSQLAGVPDRIAQLIVTDLRQGYADAVSWAFIAMAACMGVLVVLGLCYPRDGHRGRDVPVGRDDGSVRSGRGNDDD